MFEISVVGYHDIVVSVVKSIAMITQDGLISWVAAAVLLIYFPILIFRSGLDDKQPNPLKELVLTLFLFILFVAPTAPKVDLKLTSQYNISDFEIVNDVPFIVAFPYYVANTISYSLKRGSALSFAPITQNSLDEVDPLQAILKIYGQEPSPSLIYGGQSSGGGFNLKKTMNNYIKECLELDHDLDGTEPTSSVSELRKSPLSLSLIDSISVNYNGIGTTVFLTKNGSEFGEYLSCPDAHSKIKATLLNMQSAIVEYNMKQGISQTSVASAMQIITGSLTTGVSAYELQVSLFAAKLIREGLSKSAFETELDLAVFQAQKERMFAKVAERSMFESISLPVLTLLECLIFFLTPLYIILLGLGSKGLAHTAKYLMLMVFVSFWGYIDIFVDAYTYETIKSSLNKSEGFDPFSFDGIPLAMSEVEAAIATAAAATQAIPFFLMFLMYGGVHSLMGAMRGLTDVKGSGKMGAPEITGAQNNGSRNIGNASLTQSVNEGNQAVSIKGASNDLMTNLSVGDVATSAAGVAVSSANSLQTAATQSYNEQISNLRNLITGSGNNESASDGESFSTGVTKENLDSFSSGLQSTLSVSKEEADALAVKVGADVGISGSAGIKASLGAAISESNNESLKTAYGTKEAETDQLAENFKQSVQANQQSSNVNTYSETEQKQVADAVQRVDQSGAAFQEAKQRAATAVAQTQDANTLTASNNLNFASLAGNENIEGNGEEIFNAMRSIAPEQFDKTLMEKYNTNDYDTLRNNIAADKGVMNKNGSTSGSDGGFLNTLVTDLVQKDTTVGEDGKLRAETAEEKANEFQMLGTAFGMIGDSLPSGAGNQFKQASSELFESANMITDNNEMAEKIKSEVDTSITNSQKDIDTVKSATTDSETKANSTVTPISEGITQEQQKQADELRGQGAQVATDVEKAKLASKDKIDANQREIDSFSTSGVASTVGDMFKNIFSSAEPEYSFSNLQDAGRDYAQEYNQQELTSGRGQFVDPRMFDSLSKVEEAFTDGNGFDDLDKSTVVQAYSAAKFVTNNAGQMYDGDEAQAGAVRRAGSLINGIEQMLSPVNNANNDAAFSNQNDFEAFKMLTDKVADGTIDSTSADYIAKTVVPKENKFSDIFKSDNESGLNSGGLFGNSPSIITRGIDQENKLADYYKVEDDLREIYSNDERPEVANRLDKIPNFLTPYGGDPKSAEDLERSDFVYSAVSYIDSQSMGGFYTGDDSNSFRNVQFKDDDDARFAIANAAFSAASDPTPYTPSNSQKQELDQDLTSNKSLKAFDEYGKSMNEIAGLYGGSVASNVNRDLDNAYIGDTTFPSLIKNPSEQMVGGLPLQAETAKGVTSLAGIYTNEQGSFAAYGKEELPNTVYTMPVAFDGNGQPQPTGLLSEQRQGGSTDNLVTAPIGIKELSNTEGFMSTDSLKASPMNAGGQNSTPDKLDNNGGRVASTTDDKPEPTPRNEPVGKPAPMNAGGQNSTPEQPANNGGDRVASTTDDKQQPTPRNEQAGKPAPMNAGGQNSTPEQPANNRVASTTDDKQQPAPRNEPVGKPVPFGGQNSTPEQPTNNGDNRVASTTDDKQQPTPRNEPVGKPAPMNTGGQNSTPEQPANNRVASTTDDKQPPAPSNESVGKPAPEQSDIASSNADLLYDSFGDSSRGEPIDVLDQIDAEITTNDSGYPMIDVGIGGKVDIGSESYTHVGSRDLDGESIGQVLQDDTGGYHSFEFGKLKYWGDTNPNTIT
jgi:hypothetical protein|tara:strand:- start:17071 stop:22278 length:5208 start_codon:yes stop_codon:yes gene_type:complete